MFAALHCHDCHIGFHIRHIRLCVGRADHPRLCMYALSHSPGDHIHTHIRHCRPGVNKVDHLHLETRTSLHFRERHMWIPRRIYRYSPDTVYHPPRKTPVSSYYLGNRTHIHIRHNLPGANKVHHLRQNIHILFPIPVYLPHALFRKILLQRCRAAHPPRNTPVSLYFRYHHIHI